MSIPSGVNSAKSISIAVPVDASSQPDHVRLDRLAEDNSFGSEFLKTLEEDPLGPKWLKDALED